MDPIGVERVQPVPWAEGDFWLLRRQNSPETPGRLGGPETVGAIGHWERAWQGAEVWEAGWGTLPEFQGGGLAAAAARRLISVVREERGRGGHPAVHAFPEVARAASNGGCRKAGCTLLGQPDLAYPKGNPIRSDDWYVDPRGPARSEGDW
ncbi:GNAT family N-acetyltransferase [Streptomyces sp. NPDC005811]|uniref:GNAT family N-acetyltransferase n=1 Tax=Streptomyces sp. NPDC005811 TaxID=3154565 RepID=UPI0033C12A83